MPVTLTYPGVYIEEIPSGVRTIVGVATSITAFIGRAARGPTNVPVTINSFGDFERIFGGLWVDSTLGFAVRDFYLNGGSQAIIVRLLAPNFAADSAQDQAQALIQPLADAANAAATGADAKTAVTPLASAIASGTGTSREKELAAAFKAAIDLVPDAATADDVKKAVAAALMGAFPRRSLLKLPVNSTTNLALEAVSPGSWGNSLRARVDTNVPAALPASALPPGGSTADVFNLTVRDMNTGETEVYLNISIKPGPKQIDAILANNSNLVRLSGSLSGSARPEATDDVTATSLNLTTDEKKKPLLAIAPFSAQDVRSQLGDTTAATKDLPLRSVAVADADRGSDGGNLSSADYVGDGMENTKRGLYSLKNADLFNLLCLPPYDADTDIDTTLLAAAISYCELRRAFLLVDPPAVWNSADKARSGLPAYPGSTSKNAAIFFPRLLEPNPLRDNQVEVFVPCGAVAGVFARTDTQRGVWKAPAGLDATLNGVPQLSVPLTDPENGELNPIGINCLRSMPAAGRVVWGSRTLQGDDRLASEYKYIPIRRLALYIEESLFRATQWVVFEPNDEPLWAQIRLNVGAFMHDLFVQGAFQGTTPQKAYFVKCDKDTNPQNDINRGIVNIVVGFAPLKPAEFVIIKLQQIAGDILV